MNDILLGLIGGLVTGISTIFGGSIILVKNKKIENIVSKVNADFIIGVMIMASAFSLIIPAYNDFKVSFISLFVSIALGVLFIWLIQQLLKYMNHVHFSSSKVLFLIGIMAHNFPEGLASGSSMHLQNYSVLSAISLQNIPEGLITTLSFMSLGLSPYLAFMANLSTGLIEILGGIIGGYMGGTINSSLPLIMGFAGGSMMYVSIKELVERIREDSLNLLFRPSFLSGGILMYLLTLI